MLTVVFLDDTSSKFFNSFRIPTSFSEVLAKTGFEAEEVEPLYAALAKNGFLVDGHASESVTSYFPKIPVDVDIRMLYVLPTDSCNLHCKYCFLENSFGRNYRFDRMTRQTLIKGLDLFFRVSTGTENDKRKILFYGGEPLLNRDVLIDGIEYIRTHHESARTDCSLITNGSLITEGFARRIRDLDVSVSVSLDGKSDAHNMVRIHADGSGAFDEARHGFSLLNRAGVKKLSLSITIGSHNVRDLPDHVQYLMREFPVKSIGFNIMTDLPDRKNPWAVDIGFATEQMLKCFEILRERGIYEDRVMRKLRPFVERKIHLRDCGAIGNQIVLAPNGDIGPCQAFLSSRDYFNHNVNEGDIVFTADEVYKEWARRMPLKMSVCSDCPAVGICGGGCPYQARITNGSIWMLDERMCAHNRLFLEWAIWDLWRNSAGA